MAIPKGGFAKDKVEQGRYGPIFPKTPACYGFSILAKIIPGREEVFYDYAKNLEKTVAAQPGNGRDVRRQRGIVGKEPCRVVTHPGDDRGLATAGVVKVR